MMSKGFIIKILYFIIAVCLFASSISATATRQCAKSDVSCVDIQRNFAGFHNIFLNKFDAAPFSSLANCDYFFDGTNCYTFEGNRLYTATTSNPTNWYAVSNANGLSSVTADPIAIAHYGIYDYQLLKAAGANNIKGFFQAVKKFTSKSSRVSQPLGRVKPAILVTGKADSGTAATLDGDSGVCPTNYVARGAWKVEPESFYVKNKAATGCSYTSVSETGNSAVSGKVRYWTVLCVHEEVDRVHGKPVFLSVNCPTGYDYFWIGDTLEGQNEYGSGTPASSTKYFARGYNPSGNGRMLTPEQTSQQYNQRTTQRGLDKTGSNGVLGQRDGIFLCLKRGLNVPGESNPKNMNRYVSVGKLSSDGNCPFGENYGSFKDNALVADGYGPSSTSTKITIHQNMWAALCVDDMRIEGVSIQMPSCGKPPSMVWPAVLSNIQNSCPDHYEAVGSWYFNHGAGRSFGYTSFNYGTESSSFGPITTGVCSENMAFSGSKIWSTICVHEALSHKQFYPPAVFLSPFPDCGKEYHKGTATIFRNTYTTRMNRVRDLNRGIYLPRFDYGTRSYEDFDYHTASQWIGDTLSSSAYGDNQPPKDNYFANVVNLKMRPDIYIRGVQRNANLKPWELLDSTKTSFLYFIAHGTLDITNTNDNRDKVFLCLRNNIFPDQPSGRKHTGDYIYIGDNRCYDTDAKDVGYFTLSGTTAAGNAKGSAGQFNQLVSGTANEYGVLCVKRMPLNTEASTSPRLGPCCSDSSVNSNYGGGEYVVSYMRYGPGGTVITDTTVVGGSSGRTGPGYC
jgi:hypothetical protein